MQNFLAIGIRVSFDGDFPGDEIAEPLAQDLQRRIETAVQQLVFDLGENGSGHKLVVTFN